MIVFFVSMYLYTHKCIPFRSKAVRPSRTLEALELGWKDVNKGIPFYDASLFLGLDGEGVKSFILDVAR